MIQNADSQAIATVLHSVRSDAFPANFRQA